MRIDKFLWCVRIYKTRSLSSAACRTNKISIGNENVKPALEIKKGQEITVKNGALINNYKILDFPSSRISAKLIPAFIENITSAENQKRNLLILESKKENADYEFGKPTKKDRRTIRKWENV